MLVVYVGVPWLRPQRVPQDSIGVIPQLDRGYLIVVIQLPRGPRCRAPDESSSGWWTSASQLPASGTRSTSSASSAATFTQAPNSGAVFLTLDRGTSVDATRSNPRPESPASLFKRLAGIQDAQKSWSCSRRPSPDIGNAGGFRMMVEDRAGPRARRHC